MELHGLVADLKPLGDRLVGQTLGKQFKHLDLARRQWFQWLVLLTSRLKRALTTFNRFVPAPTTVIFFVGRGRPASARGFGATARGGDKDPVGLDTGGFGRRQCRKLAEDAQRSVQAGAQPRAIIRRPYEQDAGQDGRSPTVTTISRGAPPRSN
jgi:hypothetical protein